MLYVFRVGQTESLFLQTGYMNLKAYDTEDDICTCGDNFNSTKQLQEILHCAASKHCGNANYHVAPLPTAQCYTLGKVNAPNSISASSTDVHAGTETSYIPMTSIHPNTVTKKVRRIH